MHDGDVRRAVHVALAVLQPAIDRDWSVQAGDLNWSCRRTLDHIIDTLLFLAGGAATRAERRRSPVRNGDSQADIPTLLESVETSASILEAVCAGMSPHERGFHPAGRPDADGFRAGHLGDSPAHLRHCSGTWAGLAASRRSLRPSRAPDLPLGTGWGSISSSLAGTPLGVWSRSLARASPLGTELVDAPGPAR